jgi:glutathione S-transferase
MLIVYHYPICPISRKLRIILKEKKIDFQLVLEKYWERRTEFLVMNPSGVTPVAKFPDMTFALTGNSALFSFLEEKYPAHPLISQDLEEKFEVRRVTEWFDVKFYNEVVKYIMNERIIKPIVSKHHLEPNSSMIRAAKKNLAHHLDYIEYLLHDSNYLCGDIPTIADYSAAAQMSVLDFTGDILWNAKPKMKEWYALLKSRPSFRPILEDRIPGFAPPDYYSDPDF